MTAIENHRWRARTQAIDDPGRLLDRLPPSQRCVAWLRGENELIGLGEVARFETDSPQAADIWWQEFASEIDDESEFPMEAGFGPLAFGSFCFDADESAARSVLIVPEVLVGRRGGRCWLTRLSTGDPGDELPDLQPPPSALAETRVEPGALERAEWTQVVADAVAHIGGGDLQKVVLARDLLVRSSQALDLRSVLERLSAAYPTCWSFLIDGLVGASPEMLVSTGNGLAVSRVLAGTVRTGGDETAALGRLLTSAKDRGEHAFAVASVVEALQPWSHALHVPAEPAVVRLPNVMHLMSEVVAVPEPEVTSLGLAAALHPSAAVGGTPTHAAMVHIAAVEGFDRGRYAGPVGWIDAHGNGEWAVALRCGARLADDASAMRLFAGCGIVAGSDPQAEWDESEAKLAPMLAALGCSATSADDENVTPGEFSRP